MAMKKELRRLQPFFRSDEHFLETDVCELVMIADNKTGDQTPVRSQVALTLTSRALYFRRIERNPDVVRIPYERVVDLVARGQQLIVVTSLNAYMFSEMGRSMGGNKYDVLSARLKALENHSEVVAVPGGKVHAVNRKFDEDAPNVWALRPTEGVDLTSPDVKAALEQALAGAIEAYGPLQI